MKILFAGIIARYPFGGVTWCSLMYLLGLRALGHEVFYIEDTGECVYDPVQNTRATDPGYGTSYIHDALEPFGLGDRWSFVNYDGTYHGRSADDVRRYAADADLFINLSGGSWFWRDEYARIPRKVFIDSDPAFTQLAIAKAEPWYVEFFQRFDHLFTFGSNIGTPRVAGARPARSRGTRRGSRSRSTTGARRAPPGDGSRRVMTWQIESFTDVGGNKDQEFVRFIDLPSRTPQRFELAINGPQQLLREHGWDTVDAMQRVANAADYRDFIHRSKAEFGVAKHTYVATRSGWFSDRTECYLAVGPAGARAGHGLDGAPAAGEGLLAFSTPDEAVAGIDRINGDYDAARATRPREIAREHFDAGSGAAAAARQRRDRMSSRLQRSPAAIAHVAPVATTIPPPQVGLGRDDDVAADRGAGRRADTTSRCSPPATPRPAPSCTPSTRTATGTTQNMWPWELYEMLNLAAAVERAADFDIIHYEAAYYPMSLAFARLSPTPIVQTLHHSPSAAEVGLWSRYPEAPFVAISNEQARLLQRPQRRRHRAARHRHRQLHVPRDSPTTTCCFSAASPKARACCRRSRSPGAPACG